MKKINVGFDACKMKYPNTGLRTFCEQLIPALNNIAIKDNNATFEVYLPSVAKGVLPKEIRSNTLHIWDRFLLKAPHINVWHQPFQSGSYFPRGEKATLLTIHDLNYLYEDGGKRRNRMEKKVQRNINRSDRLVAISQYTKNDIIKNLDTQGKEIDVIYNGCTKYTGPITPPEQSPERPFLFNVGTLLSKKNVHVLPAILRNNDYLLYIAGNRSSYEEKIIAEAKKFGVEDRVRIIGPISESEKHWYLKNCKAFMFPSIAEGFGLPVIEAMYYGKPCFLSKHTCLPEIGADKAYYFNYEFDPDTMLNEFEKGMNDFATTNKSNAIIKHAELFSWEKAAKEYWEIYRTIAK